MVGRERWQTKAEGRGPVSSPVRSKAVDCLVYSSGPKLMLPLLFLSTNDSLVLIMVKIEDRVGPA